MGADKNFPGSVDEYIAGFPPEVRQVLETLRRTIRKAAPRAEERISYRMPAFADHGILVWFAAHRDHIGLYPTASGIRAFRRELSKYALSKGTVRFPLDKPLPLGLIARIVRFRVAENKKPRVGTLLALCLLAGAVLSCGKTSTSGGLPTDALRLPGLEEQAALHNAWLKVRFERVLPELMRREGIDMWVVVCREHAEDPVYPTLMPRPNMFAWRLSMLVFADRGEAGIECLSVNPYGSGDFNKEIGDYYRPGWTAQAEDPWARLARIVRERDPKKIAVDESRTFAFADGLSASLKAELVAALGPELSARLVSAERLAVGWLERRTAGELEFYGRLAALNRSVAAEALSAKVISPGSTTLGELGWWTREKFASLGVEAWFQPTFYIVRSAREAQGDRRVIRPGDIVRCDIGFSFLGLTTDAQELAYILRPGETEAPAGLREAMRLGNRLQDILTAEFKEGRTGNEVLAAALAKARAEGLKPRIYSHPLNYYGHGAGPRIGLGDMQDGVPGMGDYPLHADTCWAVELSVAAAIPEWGGQEVPLALEQSAVFTAAGVSYPAGRQTAFHLIKSRSRGRLGGRGSAPMLK